MTTDRDALADEQQAGFDAVEATRDPAAGLWTFDGPWPVDGHYRILFEESYQAAANTEIAAEGIVAALNVDRSAYADLRADVERLTGELRASSLKTYQANGRAIDLRTELTTAQGERDAARTALDRLQRAYHALQRSHAPVSPVACDEGECGPARAALGEAAT